MPIALVAQDPSIVGEWSTVMIWPYEPIHAHLLPTGEVLFWTKQDHSQLWDPISNVVSAAPASGANIFCSGHAFLPDGSLVVTGGHIQNFVGLSSSYKYDPFSNTWVQLPNMNNGRWYPTNTTLPNGDMLTTSGWIDTSQGDNSVPQVWQSATSAWRDLSTAELSLPFYPFMFVAPNGKVFCAGPGQASRYLDVSRTGGWSLVANSLFGTRNWGSAVMYDVGKVLLSGGTQCGPYANCTKLPTDTAEIIDLNTSSPAWKYTGSMAGVRKLHNATLLPDGTVLVTGGTRGSEDPNTNSKDPAYSSEVWDPSTDTWSTRASFTVFRGYHSVALLLPDARVLSAGGDFGGASAEVYSPPYLFKGARPTISSAPVNVNYGQSFFVGTNDATSISQVTFIALSSVTHGFNMGQRLARTSFSNTSGGLNITAPTTTNSAPPGYYMLFLINSAGVPSVAKFVKLSVAAPTPSPTPPIPVAPSQLTATAASSSQVNLAWTDNSNNETGFKIRRSINGLTFTQITAVGANVVRYSDTGRAASTKYYYRVRAYNSAGASVDSNTAVVTTAASPTPTPTISPTPAAPQLSGMTVVAAPAGTVVAPLANGYRYDLKNSLSVRADPVTGVASVLFKLDGTQLRVESAVPYSVAGDTNGTYAVWKPERGDHTLVATPYSASGGKGAAGPAVSVSFTVVNSAATPAPSATAAPTETQSPTPAETPMPSPSPPP